LLLYPSSKLGITRLWQLSTLAEETVRSYKNLAVVEVLFRSLKGIDRLVRPIRHRDESRVRAHIFLCLLAYYVRRHMQKAWAPLLYEDEELDTNRTRRDPVAPAQTSASAKRKQKLRKTEDGLPLHSFDTLLAAQGLRRASARACCWIDRVGRGQM
jgi:hypothetical protein